MRIVVSLFRMLIIVNWKNHLISLDNTIASNTIPLKVSHTFDIFANTTRIQHVETGSQEGGIPSRWFDYFDTMYGEGTFCFGLIRYYHIVIYHEMKMNVQ